MEILAKHLDMLFLVTNLIKSIENEFRFAPKCAKLNKFVGCWLIFFF